MVETKLGQDLSGRIRDDETRRRVEELACLLASEDAGAPPVEDVNDQAFERVIREAFAMGANPLTKAQADEMQSLLCSYASSGNADAATELVLFYACFEWTNRQVKDKPERLARWDGLFAAVGDDLDRFSLYRYAKSRYLLAQDDVQGAQDQAREAVRIARNHGGFLNNYGEILLSQVESERLAGAEPAAREGGAVDEELVELVERIEAFSSLKGKKIYPSFLVTEGRLLACAGKYEQAARCFDDARELIESMRRRGDSRFAREEDYIAEVATVINAQSTASALRSSAAVWQSLREAQDAMEARAEELSRKTDEIEQKLADEHVHMLEFLGFFSGIISFIIASIQVGSEMDFPARAALIVIMLGSLLVGFGALGWLIDGMRVTAPTKRANPLIVVGAAVIVLGCVGYFALKLVA